MTANQAVEKHAQRLFIAPKYAEGPDREKSGPSWLTLAGGQEAGLPAAVRHALWLSLFVPNTASTTRSWISEVS
jgi:hypothetical protein